MTRWKSARDATESAGSGYSLTRDNYFCKVWGLHKDIGDQTRANYDKPLDADRDATQFLTQRAMLRQEAQWVTDHFKTGVWGTDATGGSTFNYWDSYAISDPITDIETAKETILSQTGFEANTLVLGYTVFRWLKNHPDIVERIKYTSANVITEDIMAKYFGVDRVLVAKAVINTAAEGVTASYGFTHGKNALLLYVAPAPSILNPSAGYTFSWKGVSEGLGTNVGMTRFRMQHLRADRIECQLAWANKLVMSDLGYFFHNATQT